jgi:hypothetical protein
MNGLSLFGSEALGIHCIFDPTHTSRYVWSYELSDPTRRLMFSGLNPSKADEHRFDNTVKKWIAWTRAWGFGALGVVNAYAHRSTDPKKLREVEDPVGPENDRYVLEIAARATLRVVGWGGSMRRRGIAACVWLNYSAGINYTVWA